MGTVITPQRWQRLDRPGFWIQLHGTQPTVPSYPDHTSLTETQADTIMEWSMQNKIGVRMSFDIWKFRNEKEMLVFIMKWC